jgi:hypothetical protein
MVTAIDPPNQNHKCVTISVLEDRFSANRINLIL